MYEHDRKEAKATGTWIGDYSSMQWIYLSDAREMVNREQTTLRAGMPEVKSSF